MANPASSVTSSPESSSSTNFGGSGNNNNLLHLPITGHKLNGQNYFQWSQSVKMFICGKGKDDFITRVAESPRKEDSAYKQWKTENNMVMSWLINSMNNDIGENFLLYETAIDIWEAAKETYSSNDNTSELFGIESILHDLQQRELNALISNQVTIDQEKVGLGAIIVDDQGNQRNLVEALWKASRLEATILK
ncbi:hypothetical protein LWI29_013031 [Acer saccharum]|uniref:Retrotransposon Copia-like N-terminal domain-containing protein n=1 Tax=Acer saccharum TaxID=4024 RepID=A0AA39SC53_ACESA|nr:hypothetical protein LWI29_013031 [Acer saccharum]